MRKNTITLLLALLTAFFMLEGNVALACDPPPPPDPDCPTCVWTNTNTLSAPTTITNNPNNTNTNTNLNLNNQSNTMNVAPGAVDVDINNNPTNNVNTNAESNLTNVIGISNDSEANVNFSYKAERNLPNIISPPSPGGILPIPGEMVNNFTVSTILPVFGGPWDSKKIKYSGKTKGVDLFIKEVFTHSETAVNVIPWFDLSTLPKELANYKGLIYGGETRKYISERKIDKYAPMYVVSDGIKEVIEGIHPNLLVVAIADEDIIKSKSFYIGAAIGGSGIPSKEAGVSATIGGGYTSSTGKTVVRPGAAVFGFHYDYYEESPPVHTHVYPPKTSEGW